MVRHILKIGAYEKSIDITSFEGVF